MARGQYDDEADNLRLDEIGGTDESADDRASDGKRKGFFARHKVLTTFLVLIGLLVGSVVGFAFYLNSKLSDVDTYVSKLDDKDRVPKASAPPGQSGPPPVNILLLGADATSGKSIAELVAADTWDAGSMRSDTIMMVHIPSDRSRVYLMSFPRDSWVNIPGRSGNDKINAAFSYGGPDLALQTVEQYSQVHIDHVMMIDWEGFKDLTDALGGVSLHEPGQGQVKMNGEQALEYVRTRKSLPNGDFDRIKRQQNFLRQLMAQTVDSLSITDPLMLADVLNAITSNTTVDASFTPSVMRDLAWELRGIKTGNVTFFTVPTNGTGMEGDQSVVYLDDAANKELFKAVNEGLLPQYLNSNPPDSLPDPTNVN
ncbi:LCP family protein [Blastococcus sp. Marseille-P5729]|uniref:LCP family protein n=1 Tax=Blastococcus sp. Marseille-P5729 TaxID=2086582 RepID=UPI000D105911|nr:LCP family protein [Blastococcus sp. Marseille-P5729]